MIEIRGTGFINKGAELMLRSISAKLKSGLPNVALTMEPFGNQAPYLKRAEMGLYQKLWFKRCYIQWGYLGFLIPKKLRRMYGLVLDSEIDVVLDASGFAYGDQWGPLSSLVTAEAIKKWKNQGTKVVFMPQAFGPFTDDKIKSAFKTVVEHADLIFAREKASYDFIIQLVGEREHIKIAPDFTNLMRGQLPDSFDYKANRFCVIPNYRMIEKAPKEQSDAYLPFLIECTKYLYNKGAKPFILIHEGRNDLWIAKEVAKSIGHNINIIRETNPLYIKGIVGSSEGVISSRFHGLVSALSQGVPALATGWSHKYEMLFKDYSFPEGILPANSSYKEMQNKVDILISDTTRRHLKEKIINASKLHEKASIEMWDTVLNLIS